MSLVVQLTDEAATLSLGVRIARYLVGGDVVLLSGVLGAGKTTLTKGLVAGLGASVEVTSPTFALCHIYPTTPVVAHVDCWRMESPDEFADLGVDEVLDEGGVAVIEWGERAELFYGQGALRVTLIDHGDSRSVTLEATDERWSTRLSRMTEEMATKIDSSGEDR